MVGVCITVISIVSLIEISAKIATVIDKIMSVDSMIFLASVMLSYLSLRSRRFSRSLERTADIIFLSGLTLMVVASFILAWDFGITDQINAFTPHAAEGAVKSCLQLV